MMRPIAKEHTLGWWKKEFWKVFSLYIRTRDKFICFTCGAELERRNSQAGHMIPRAAGGLSLYFNEDNVHCQCYRCNINLGGNGAEYARRFILKYGQKSFDKIIKLRDTGYLKYTIEDYQRLIGEYKVKIKNEEEKLRNGGR